MDYRQLVELTRRVYRLEQLLTDLQDRLGVPETEREVLPAPAALEPPSPARDETPAAPPARDETEVLGRWLARVGAVVLLVGFGFAFKYAVDRGFIGPGARVALGLATGVALVGAGEWASKRDWAAWAQAVIAAGIAVSYLSILAAARLYDLLGPASAFASLVAITILGALLALRHDSVVLGVLALAGGYLNAIILASEQPRPVAVFVYVLALDAGVLGLAAFRPWHVLDAVALAGTAIVFGTAAGDATFAAALTRRSRQSRPSSLPSSTSAT